MPSTKGLRRVSEEVEAQEFANNLLPDAVFVCTEDGGDLAVNHTYLDVVGRSVDEVRGYLFERWIHPNDRDRITKLWREFCADRSDSFFQRFRFSHRTQGWITIEVIGHHRPNGQHYGFVRDVTLRVEAENLGVL